MDEVFIVLGLVFPVHVATALDGQSGGHLARRDGLHGQRRCPLLPRSVQMEAQRIVRDSVQHDQVASTVRAGGHHVH